MISEHYINLCRTHVVLGNKNLKMHYKLQVNHIQCMEYFNWPGSAVQISKWASKRWDNKLVIQVLSGLYNDPEINSESCFACFKYAERVRSSNI
jgi:hypothetical protein